MINENQNLKLISKKTFVKTNAKYKKLIKNSPNFLKDSPIEIYKWVEELVKLSKLK